MDAEILYTIRNFGRAAEVRGVNGLDLMRDYYRATRAMLVARGYGSAKDLDEQAAEWATRGLGPKPHDDQAQGAWYTIGLGMVQAAHESQDLTLES